jgi:exosortase
VSDRSLAAATSALPAPKSEWHVLTLRIGGSDATFFALVAVATAWSWRPLSTVVTRSLQMGEYEHYSHILLMPFASAYLIYLNRSAIFAYVRRGRWSGTLSLALGAATLWLAGSGAISAERDARLSLAMLGSVTLWAGGFLLCYGPRALRAATLPFVLLLFMIPLPPRALAAVVVFLQHASADASALLFGLIGMPVFRQGLTFELVGLTIEVAEECSGIRSSLALLITGVVMADLLLRASWTRAALLLVIVPLAIAKNAVRIVGLSWLAVHVDPGFITGSAVHRSSGIPVFLVSLSILATLAWLLRRAEAWQHQ